MTRNELKAIEARVADGFTHVGDNRILLARITELEAENKRILGSHDAYADKYEDELLDRKSAEALADDLENQIAELTLGMDDAEAALERALADGAAMRAALEKAAVLDVGRPIPRGGYEAALVEGIVRGQDEARDYVKAIVAKALTDHPGDKLLAELADLRDAEDELAAWQKRCGAPLPPATPPEKE